MESTEAINLPVSTKDAHKENEQNCDGNVIKNIEQESSTIDPTGTNVQSTQTWIHSNYM